jgi:threonine dehydrogenase-like Zn-dependent dehydrogenase
VQIICSQIFAVTPSLSYRWNVPRLERTIMALQGAGRLELVPLITHEIPFREAEAAYRLLDEHPDTAVQVTLTFPEGLERIGLGRNSR